MKIINTNMAPWAIWPYSQAIICDWFLYTSGQIGLSPDSMQIVSWWIVEQTRQVLNNLNEILIAAWVNKDNVIKVTIFLKDMNDFNAVNEIYGIYFETHKPARSTVEVSRLPKDVLIEIDFIAKV